LKKGRLWAGKRVGLLRWRGKVRLGFPGGKPFERGPTPFGGEKKELWGGGDLGVPLVRCHGKKKFWGGRGETFLGKKYV